MIEKCAICRRELDIRAKSREHFTISRCCCAEDLVCFACVESGVTLADYLLAVGIEAPS